MPFKYVFVPPSPGEYEDESRRLSRPFRQFLYNRLNLERGKVPITLSSLTLRKVSDPLLMEGMAAAVDRLKRAIERGERILVHGDYDADGLTALALMYYALKWLGADVIPFVPDRFADGYGLSERGVRYAKDVGAKLLLTVDCGVSSHGEVELAKGMGMDVIITDHHQVPDELPDAVVVHPALGEHPDRYLTGVGVAFKVALALYRAMGKSTTVLYSLLDLVAVGTVADVGTMLGENRLLVKHGIRLINTGRDLIKEGLKAVIETSRITLPLGAWNIAWQIAPRINAAGRMGRVKLAMNLLLSNDGREAVRLARELEALNRKRRMKQDRLFRSIRAKVDPSEPIVFVADEGVDEGIAGILASKLMEEFGRPAVVVSLSDGMAKGSVRSIEPFDVYEALKLAEGMFGEGENFGGHTLAGGFRISEEKLDGLKRAMIEYALSRTVGGRFAKVVEIDAEVEPREMDADFWEDYNHFRPYGHGFPSPVFILKLRGRPVETSNGYSRYLEHYEGGKRFQLRIRNPDLDPKGDLVITSLRPKAGVIHGDVLGSL